MMRRWSMCLLGLTIGLAASACSTTAPVSAAKFVKMPQDAPRGKVTATTALVINRPDQGDSDASEAITPDMQIGGFWTEGSTSWFSERYDATLGVVNGVLMYEGNVNLVTGKTRLGIIHGVGSSLNIEFGDETQYALGVPLTLGLFFQNSTDSLHHLYGALRYAHTRTISDAEDDGDGSNSLGLNLGYMIMDGRQGLSLAPELGVVYGLDENENNLAILLGVSMSANFL